MDLLNTIQAAPRIGVAPGTLENWRTQGIGPKFIKTTSGRRGKVLYDPADIEAWKQANRYGSTSEVTA
ncbi:DNA-binding transcriptional MerR regulator [Sphingobium xenophagum]|uniref:DNA-binding transcriptional MerR regulator n=2 Tax=Sphingobium xenophagum TaxID=121428 RepID=A0ABU1X1D7_SPHXE|nr:DNA-binding transcriptional MerR regulator [Sphingobium xenophagum]